MQITKGDICGLNFVLLFGSSLHRVEGMAELAVENTEPACLPARSNSGSAPGTT